MLYTEKQANQMFVAGAFTVFIGVMFGLMIISISLLFK